MLKIALLIAAICVAVAAMADVKADRDNVASGEFVVYNIIPFSPGKESVAAADAIDLKRRTGVDLALYSLTLHPEGRPAIEKAKCYIESFRAFKKELEGSGVRAGILVQAILGHWPRVDKDIEDWTRTIDSEGKEVRFCPDDPGFAAYITEVFTLIAKSSPAFVMTDDDVRAFSPKAECFCARHVAMFNERRGSSFTSEQLRERIKAARQDDPDYAAFLAMQREMVEGVVRRARAAMDAVDPAIPAGICVAGEEHLFCASLARAIAAKGQTPVMRTSTGCYDERMTCAKLPQIVCRMFGFAEYYRESGIDLLAESDTCPHNLWSKSATSFYTHLINAAFVGMKGSKTWFVNCHKGKYPVSRNYTAALEGLPRLSALSAEVEGSEWEGIAVPCLSNFPNWHVAKNQYEFFIDNNCAAVGIFAPFGIPFYATRDFGGGRICALASAAEVSRLSDDDLRRILSGKAVVFREAAIALTERGFASLTGVEAAWWNLAFNRERDDMNGGEAVLYSPMSGSVRFAVSDGAEVLSSLVFHDTSGVKPDEMVTPGAVLFANALGGRVLTVQYHAGMFCLQRYTESRHAWLVSALERLNGEPLPFVSGHEQDVLMLVRRKGAGQWLLLVENLNPDPIGRLRLKTPFANCRVELLLANGVWKPIEASFSDGILECEAAIPFYGTAVLRVVRR